MDVFRFVDYGVNRLINVAACHHFGLQFAVLSNVFLIHDGLKTSDAFHDEKPAQLKRNQQLLYQVISSWPD